MKKTIHFTRQELYDLVWKKTMGEISRLYGISSHALRAACTELKVPLPYASYWIQVKYDRAWLTKLPQDYTGPDSIEILKKKYDTKTYAAAASPIVVRTKEIEKDPKAPLTVPQTLTKPDRLIRQTKEYWDKRRKNKNYREQDPEIIFLNVADSNFPRALQFMDGLIKLLQYRGHAVQKNRYSQTVAVIDGIEIELYLREASKRIAGDTPGSSSELIRTGDFIFQVGKYSDQKEWRDGAVPIEGLLARIAAKLELLAEKEKEKEEQRRLRQIEREKQEALERAAAQRKEKEVQDFKALLQAAERFDQAAKLCNYVQAVQQQADPMDGQIEQWIVWAEKKISWMDPLLGTSDEIFTDYDLEHYKKW